MDLKKRNDALQAHIKLLTSSLAKQEKEAKEKAKKCDKCGQLKSELKLAQLAVDDQAATLQDRETEIAQLKDDLKKRLADSERRRYAERQAVEETLLQAEAQHVEAQKEMERLKEALKSAKSGADDTSALRMKLEQCENAKGELDSALEQSKLENMAIRNALSKALSTQQQAAAEVEKQVAANQTLQRTITNVDGKLKDALAREEAMNGRLQHANATICELEAALVVPVVTAESRTVTTTVKESKPVVSAVSQTTTTTTTTTTGSPPSEKTVMEGKGTPKGGKGGRAPGSSPLLGPKGGKIGGKSGLAKGTSSMPGPNTGPKGGKGKGGKGPPKGGKGSRSAFEVKGEKKGFDPTAEINSFKAENEAESVPKAALAQVNPSSHDAMLLEIQGGAQKHHRKTEFEIEKEARTQREGSESAEVTRRTEAHRKETLETAEATDSPYGGDPSWMRVDKMKDTQDAAASGAALYRSYSQDARDHGRSPTVNVSEPQREEHEKVHRALDAKVKKMPKGPRRVASTKTI